jgi:tRNA(Leu) C34 or U34 (ribose-2'-O)-methylase TrmL
MARGHVTIALHNPKNAINVGSVLRAAGCYSADLVVIGGKQRWRCGSIPSDTHKTWRHIPTLTPDDVMDSIPFGAIPIAVDLLPGAIPLPDFAHPERAFYIFGPEDSTLGTAIHERCKWKVVVPTTRCMNLAATVNVVLYDRLTKSREWSVTPKPMKEAA